MNSRHHRSGNILDIRPAETFERAHHRGAASLPLPAGWTADSLEQDLPSIFLPPRHEPLTVVADTRAEAEMVAAHLRLRGDRQVTARAFAAGALPADELAVGPESRPLWSPPPYLRFAEPFLPPPAMGSVLDLACGSGRALVWLAERGYRTMGVDWQPEALEMARRLAASRGVDGEFRAADLRDSAAWPRGPWAIILNFRFLQRELLEEVPRWLQPGGVAVLRTFRDLPGYEGHPHPRHRLGAGELLHVFRAASCEILAHEENFDPDGRPAAGIVVRRRPAHLSKVTFCVSGFPSTSTSTM